MNFHNLPPLNTLRSFEAAARLGSFTLAAEELHVTPSAISQQIKKLEVFMGTPLFRRGMAAIELTQTGRELLLVWSQALVSIEKSVVRVKEANRPKTTEEVCLSASPSFVNLWLVKRIAKFQNEIRDIKLSLNATRSYVDFEAESVDMAIRHGVGHWPGLHAEFLMKDNMVAVCSPVLLGRRKLPRTMSDLRSFSIIEDRIHRYWQRYIKSVNEDFDMRDAVFYDDSGVIVEAAIGGQGVALARESLAEAALRDGRLIKLFDGDFGPQLGYYIVYPAKSATRKNVIRISNWLKREAAISDFQEKNGLSALNDVARRVI